MQFVVVLCVEVNRIVWMLSIASVHCGRCRIDMDGVLLVVCGDVVEEGIC